MSDARLPSLFVGTGGPMTSVDRSWMQKLSAWASTFPRPGSILVFSAHWEQRPITIGATKSVPLIYDFSGFPEHYYDIRYAPPGAPELAQRLRRLFGAANMPFDEDPERGLDHGAYPALMGLYPAADIPVLILSLPSEQPRELFELGGLLAPLRDEGVLIVSTGYLIHNLPAFFGAIPRPAPGQSFDEMWNRTKSEKRPIPAWVQTFDDWVADVLERKDWDALLDYQRRAPFVRQALPTVEHFVPLLVSAGTVAAQDPVTFPIEGFQAGVATQRCVQFG